VATGKEAVATDLAARHFRAGRLAGGKRQPRREGAAMARRSKRNASDDNADAVAVHDAEEAEYYRLAASSGLARTRLRVKELNDPFDQTTERQLLVGIAVIGALFVWRLGGSGF
jgi:hypothetical protein